MSTFLLIVQLIPALIAICRSLEAVVSAAKQGHVKKEAAIGLISGGLDLAVKAGGLKAEDAEKVKPQIGNTVDLVVGVLNAAGLLKPEPAPVQS